MIQIIFILSALVQFYMANQKELMVITAITAVILINNIRRNKKN